MVDQKISLKDSQATLHSDGYEAYHKLDNVMSVGCFAHDRRKFVEATEAASRDRGSRNLANKAVHDIRQIFMWEEHITNLPAEETYARKT